MVHESQLGSIIRYSILSTPARKSPSGGQENCELASRARGAALSHDSALQQPTNPSTTSIYLSTPSLSTSTPSSSLPAPHTSS